MHYREKTKKGTKSGKERTNWGHSKTRKRFQCAGPWMCGEQLGDHHRETLRSEGGNRAGTKREIFSPGTGGEKESKTEKKKFPIGGPRRGSSEASCREISDTTS